MTKETDRKETDNVKVELKNMGTINKNCVTINKGSKQVNLYFSYETIIAVNQYVSVNDWSMTTGKFLNELQADKNKRIPHKEVLQKVEELLKEVLQWVIILYVRIAEKVQGLKEAKKLICVIVVFLKENERYLNEHRRT